MKTSSVFTALGTIIVGFLVVWTSGCGDNHASITPAQQRQQDKVAFISGRGTNDVTGEPYVMNRSDGSGVTLIGYSGVPAIPRCVTVSPDSSRLLAEIDGNQPTQIYTAKVDGADWTPLTSSGSNRAPRWSPDGKQIVFHSNRDGSPGPWKVHLMNSDGSNQTRLSPLDNATFDLSPSFSPDGKQIAFVSWDGTSFGIWTMNTDGTNRRLVTNLAVPAYTAAFSPDGTKILWVGNDNYEIESVNLDGSSRTMLTNSGGKIYEVMTLGNEVWFTTSQDGNGEVYKMNADGSGQKNMTNNPYADAMDLYNP